MLENIEWERRGSYWYETLGHFQVKSVIENASGLSLLDFACGDGFLTSKLSKHFKKVVGVDSSENCIRKAKKLCPNADFYVSSIETFKSDERFETITLLNILEHVDDPIIALKNASALLEKQGKIVAQVPNARAINRRLGQKMEILEDLYSLSDWDINFAGHKRYYDMRLLIQDFEKSGLKIITTGGIIFKTLSTAQIEWFLSEGLWQSGQFGWGGEDKDEDWRFKFCNALYEIGREYSEDCNLVYVVAMAT